MNAPPPPPNTLALLLQAIRIGLTPGEQSALLGPMPPPNITKDLLAELDGNPANGQEHVHDVVYVSHAGHIAAVNHGDTFSHTPGDVLCPTCEPVAPPGFHEDIA